MIWPPPWPLSAGAEVVMAERTTFYGSKEFGIKDPAGHCPYVRAIWRAERELGNGP
jgi:hypothetical protein